MSEQDAVIQSLGALMGEEPEVGQGFLLASVYARALRTGQTPRNVLEDLWKVMPGSETWPQFRAALLQVLEG